MPNLPIHLLGLQEVPRPLVNGDLIRDSDGDMAAVLEVTALQSTHTVAGQQRQLYVALHAGAGSAVVFVCLKAGQQEWVR
jgi:hypothetical protein